MIAGVVRILDVPSGSAITLNAEYDVVTVSNSGGTVQAVILDNNDSPFVVSIGGTAEFTELWIAKKVI